MTEISRTVATALQSLRQREHTTRLAAQISDASHEVTTGLKAKPYDALGHRSADAIAIRMQIVRNDGFLTSNALLDRRFLSVELSLGAIREAGQGAGAVNAGFVGFRDLFPTLLAESDAAGLLTPEEAGRSFDATAHDHATYGYDAYQGRQFKFRGIREARYKYAWSPHDLEELYDLETDPQERINRAEDPALKAEKARLKTRLFDWMQAEGDALAFGGYHLPVGSYIDGRPAQEQHDHQQHLNPALKQ